MTAPLTVIINFRNAERFLEETLRSIASQRDNVPIVAIDNQSSDSSARIAESFPGVRLIRTSRLMPLGEARNVGLGYVETPYVTWLDSDDLWEPDFTRGYFEAFRRHPEASFFCSGSICIDERGNPLSGRSAWVRRYTSGHGLGASPVCEPGETFADLVTLMRPHRAWCSYVFKTEAVRAGGGLRPELRFAEDLELIGRLLIPGDAVRLRADLTRYRVHAAQATSTVSAESRYGEALAVVTELGLSSGRLTEEVADRLRRVVAFKTALAHCINGEWRTSAVRVLRSLADPGVLSWLWCRSTGRTVV